MPEALTTGKIAPGLAYVPTLKKFVVWNGGESLYALDGKTWKWSRIVNSNLNQIIPTQANKNGTYGRFRYIPSKNALIVVNSIYENVYIYKLEGSGVEYDTIITNTNANIYLNFDVVLTKIIMKHNKINDSIALYNKNSLFFGKLK
ncbi:hypothetical protein CSA08_04285 [Candidatus Gracilibacteria bacterium]|nr:MAG: hypothetical protein CSA08_04285 [Candidatus Gracilibacteria bacterium]